jgi:transcriptional adapter 3
MSIVKDRMAYQEYETARDAQERVIEAGWHKRQRTDSKKKKKGTQKDKDRGNKPSAVGGGGGGEEDPSKVPVSPVLMEAVEKRNALVESFKPFFEEDGGRSRWWGIPETSVYEGMMESIDEDEDGEVEVG